MVVRIGLGAAKSSGDDMPPILANSCLALGAKNHKPHRGRLTVRKALGKSGTNRLAARFMVTLDDRDQAARWFSGPGLSQHRTA